MQLSTDSLLNFRHLIFTSLILMASPSFAYLTLHDTGEILPQGHYSLGAEPQIVTSGNTGLNLGVFIDAPLNDAAQARISMGAGVTDFWVSAAVKYIPFPDVDNQPAIGFRGALSYGRDENLNMFSISLTPLVSKKTQIRHGELIPYVGLPITHTSHKEKSFVSSQFAIGSEFTSYELKDYVFGGEVAFNLNQSFSYISAYIKFPFEASQGYKR